MFHRTDDLRIEELRPLLPPAILIEEIPLTEQASEVVATARRSATEVILGRDDRLLAVVGPCSIHDTEAALEYGGRLREVAGRLSEHLHVIMRVYFEKPRTTVGWKGLINDPHLNGTFEINTGLRLARTLLADLAELGLPAGTEYLDTISPQFIADLVSWGAIGARTTESQVHRELASGLSMPVGFKNGTDGNVRIAIDAIGAARHPHRFLSVTKQGISAIVSTTGNDACHIILRGASGGPNYSRDDVEATATMLESGGLEPAVMIDCSHGNSRKDYVRQPLVARAVADQLRSGSTNVRGVMIESHLLEGRQDLEPDRPGARGQSITDACLGWDDTERVLEGLAEAVEGRRSRLRADALPPSHPLV